MDVEKIRRDIPILNQQIGGRPMVYFDNACMSLRPQAVIDKVTEYYTQLSACAGRSNHRLARKVNEEVENSRKKIQQFIGAKHSQEIIFTRNTTEGINLVAHSLELGANEIVLTSGKEHNSNLVPWLKLAKKIGIKHKVISQNEDNTWNMDNFEAELEKAKGKVKLVGLVQTSNLDGVTFPIKEITKTAHRAGALVLVDAAQSAPHQKINVQDLEVDFLAFSGHKLMGPSGMGVLYGKRELLDKMEGFLVGGDTVEYTTYTDYKHLPLPEKYEAGLQDYAGVMGLGAATDYLAKIDRQALARHEAKLNTIMTEGIKDLTRVHLIGPKEPHLRGGVLSFYVDGADPHQIALLLDQSYGIMVRSGQHCVNSWFNAHQITGSVRASVYLYNTEEEAKYFVQSLKKVMEVV